VQRTLAPTRKALRDAKLDPTGIDGVGWWRRRRACRTCSVR